MSLAWNVEKNLQRLPCIQISFWEYLTVMFTNESRSFHVGLYCTMTYHTSVMYTASLLHGMRLVVILFSQLAQLSTCCTNTINVYISYFLNEDQLHYGTIQSKTLV